MEMHKVGGLQVCRGLHSTGAQASMQPLTQTWGAYNGMPRPPDMVRNGQVWSKLEPFLDSQGATLLEIWRQGGRGLHRAVAHACKGLPP